MAFDSSPTDGSRSFFRKRKPRQALARPLSVRVRDSKSCSRIKSAARTQEAAFLVALTEVVCMVLVAVYQKAVDSTRILAEQLRLRMLAYSHFELPQKQI